MDKEIFEKYNDSKPPFNGKVLYTLGMLPLPQLRELTALIIKYIKEHGLLDKVYKVNDWFEHDGYLPPKNIVSNDYIFDLIKTNESFYENRSEEKYVCIGLFDYKARWYIRLYIADENDLKDGEERCGRLDISVSNRIVNLVKKYIEENGYFNLGICEPKQYFTQRYAGKNNS